MSKNPRRAQDSRPPIENVEFVDENGEHRKTDSFATTASDEAFWYGYPNGYEYTAVSINNASDKQPEGYNRDERQQRVPPPYYRMPQGYGQQQPPTWSHQSQPLLPNQLQRAKSAPQSDSYKVPWSDDAEHEALLLQSGYGALAKTTRHSNRDRAHSAERKRSKPPPMHRRSSSDNLDPTKTDPLSTRKRPATHQCFSSGSSLLANRQRSYSAGRMHRRASSLASSVISEASLVSHISDIRKSSLARQVGSEVQLHYPFEKVHLTMNPMLCDGPLYLYKIEPPTEECFEQYHRVAQDALCHDNVCHCQSQDLLPDYYYALTVEDDLYQRVMDEICQSKKMPCGLFFCGHHEDVNRPSIAIAVGLVASLLCAMIAVAYIMRG